MKRLIALLLILLALVAAPAHAGVRDLLPARGAADWDISLYDFADAIDAALAAAGTGTATVRNGTRANRVAFATPYDGLVWIETDQTQPYAWVYDGAAWVLIAPSSPAIPVDQLYMDPDNPGTNTIVGATTNRKAEVIKLVDGSTQGFLGSATLPDNSRDYQLVIECEQSTSLTGKYIALKVEILAIQAGEDPAGNAADVTSTQAIACRADTGLLVVTDANFKITSASLHTTNQLVRVGIFRVGGSSSPTDDHTGDTYVIRAYFVAL